MADTGDARIRLTIEGHLATITLARPEKLNALDYEMVLALERAAHVVDAEKNVRAVIITGEGDKSFCAGGDIAAWSAWSPTDFGMAWVRHGHRALAACHADVVARDGLAVDGGDHQHAVRVVFAPFQVRRDQVLLLVPQEVELHAAE